VSGSPSTGRRVKVPFGECFFFSLSKFLSDFVLSSLPVVDGEGPRNFVV
jgi:hypothetical protein